MAQVSISVFAADILKVEKELHAVKEYQADSLHIDVMDGHFVPLFGFNSIWAKKVGNYTSLGMDIHFMLYPTAQIINQFLNERVKTVIFHLTSAPDEEILRHIAYIKHKGKRAGIAISPDAAIEKTALYLTIAEEVLIMSTAPGEENSQFVEHTYERIAEVKALIGDRNICIAVDGGLDINRAEKCIIKGADKIILGRTYFAAKHKEKLIHKIHQMYSG